MRTSQRRADVRANTPSAPWRRVAATLTLVAVAASGCAGSDSADDAPAETTQTAPTAVVEPATVRDAIADGAKVIDVRT
ncbi:MAG: hypothetical protein Q7J48_08320, partial [Nocardioides sp.]|nr:hypothetical protein [Nocardioides sp.]